MYAKIYHLFCIFAVLVLVGCSTEAQKTPFQKLSTPTKIEPSTLTSTKSVLPTDPSFQRTPTTTLTPVWNFDAKAKIAFAFFQLGNTGIYTSSLSKKLTLEQPVDWNTSPSFYGHPTWSPDGKSLAFEFDRGNGVRIYVANQDGTNLRMLTNQLVTAVLSEPDWSPDNGYIAFTTGLELYIIKPDGSGLKKLASQRTLTQPTWSSDGKYVAFLADSKADFSGAKIYIVDKNGENLRTLTGPNANILSGISWSPDNQRLVFGSVVEGCRDISIINIATGEINHFIGLPGFDKDPIWSPDGRHIVFSSGNEASCGEHASRTPYGSYQLFAADVNSGAISPAISPEGAIQSALWPLVSIHLGWTYQITELGTNLNVRQSPSLSSPKLDSLKNQEKFTALDGPINADGYQWWKIKTEQDEPIGWVADVPGWYIFENLPNSQP